MSPASNWPSPSMLTITSAPRRSAASRPVAKAAPTPRLAAWLTTAAPASRARPAVSSVEPSSTTTTSVESTPSITAGMQPMTSAMVSASLSAGMMTTSFMAPLLWSLRRREVKPREAMRNAESGMRS